MANASRWSLVALTSAALLAIGIMGSCCQGNAHRRVGATEFASLARQEAASMSGAQFIGVCGGRAYLSHWQMGILGNDTDDVYSVALDELPVDERTALLEGRNPWLRLVGTNDPGLRPEEQRAILDTMRLPARNPVVVVLRCRTGRRPEVARHHFDNTFTEDSIVPLPAPGDLVLVVTAEEEATLRINGQEGPRLHAAETFASWQHIAEPGPVEVSVQGSTSAWSVHLRCASGFFSPAFDQQRSR